MVTQAALSLNLGVKAEIEPTVLDQARRLINEFGCFIAKDLFSHSDIDAIQSEVRELIQLRRSVRKLPPVRGSRFDSGIMELIAIDRQEGSFIYNACRQLISIHALDVRPQLINLSKALIATDFISASNVKVLRMDLPGEDKFLYPWHQDFPYVQDSEDALVYWFPIHDLLGNGGGLTCAIGSHKHGVYPVVVGDAENKNKNRALSISLAEPNTPHRFPQFSLTEMKAGDVLVFKTLLLHTSIANHGELPRWTIQLRHGNYRNSKIVEKGWPGGNSLTSSFEVTHPEYVVKK